MKQKIHRKHRYFLYGLSSPILILLPRSNYSTGYQVFFTPKVKEAFFGFPLSNSTGALGTCSSLKHISLFKKLKGVLSSVW